MEVCRGPQQTRKNILWLKGGGLGDFVLALPTLAALRHAFPAAQIIAACPLRWADLTRGLCDATSDLDGLEWLGLHGTQGQLPSLLKETSLALVYRADGDGRLKVRLEQAGVRRVLCHSPRPGVGQGHAATHLALPLVAMGIPVDPCPKICHPDGGGCPSGVLIHPGAGGVAKRWPLDRFVALAEGLIQAGYAASLVAGPDEVERGEVVRWRETGIPVVVPERIWALAEMVARAQLYVGNDSGGSHLAAAIGCPALVLFGPTSEQVWAPRGPNVRILNGGTFSTGKSDTHMMEAIPVEAVLQEALSMLPGT